MELSAADDEPVVEQLGEELAAVQLRRGQVGSRVAAGREQREGLDVDPQIWAGPQADAIALTAKPALAERSPQPVEQIRERAAYLFRRGRRPQVVGQGLACEGPARLQGEQCEKRLELRAGHGERVARTLDPHPTEQPDAARGL